MDLNLSPYHFAVIKGTGKTSGKYYRKAVLNKDITFNGVFIDKLIEAGTKVIDVDELAHKKTEKKIKS